MDTQPAETENKELDTPLEQVHRPEDSAPAEVDFSGKNEPDSPSVDVMAAGGVQEELSEAALPSDLDSDVIYYLGSINRDGYTQLTKVIEEKIIKNTKKDNLVLILTTQGGDPDYGYRIGRAINYYYKNTTVLIPDLCKSAGTLIAIAGKKLVIGDLGELGPLDIQFRKSDEMGEHASTLNIFKTVNELQNATLESFRHFVTDIRFGSGIGTKLSAEIASNLTKALISPLAAQIDPIKLGEHNRALRIAREYAYRLNQTSNNLHSDDALDRLISGYPCHSFVIDRKEAKQLFKLVCKPETPAEAFIYLFARHFLMKRQSQVLFSDEPIVTDLTKVLVEYREVEEKAMADPVEVQLEESIPE